VQSLAETLYTDTVTCVLDKDITVSKFVPTNFRGQTVVFFNGKNLNPSGNFQVTINGISCGIKYNSGVLIATIPPTLGLNLPNIPVIVYTGTKIVFQGSGNTNLLKATEVIKVNQEVFKMKTFTHQ
jgi:hypothetical protein